MAVDYLEIMGALGGIASNHPQTTALAMQTYSNWNAHYGALVTLFNTYQKSVAAAQASGKQVGTLDQVGIIMQLLEQNPWVVPLVTQTLAAWQSRVTDGIAVLNEFQQASVNAAKT